MIKQPFTFRAWIMYTMRDTSIFCMPTMKCTTDLLPCCHTLFSCYDLQLHESFGSEDIGSVT